jgi:Zn-finger nucleic acid-binding protein
VNCSSCGAPLPPKSNVCRYCTALNETDLRTLKRRGVASGASKRACPRCADKKLVVLRIPGFDGIELDRCEECHGIFFDPGELEAVLDKASNASATIDYDELQRLVAEERGFDTKVVYLRCPVCRQLMDRKIHGRKSGIVTDRCMSHGVWLDGGELAALAKWCRAGGREHTAETTALEREQAAERERLDKMTRVGARDLEQRYGRTGESDFSEWAKVLGALRGLGK